MTLEQDPTRAINPGGRSSTWNVNADPEDAVPADEDDERQFAASSPPGAHNWGASRDDDGDALSKAWHHFSWILVPIPFAIIIFLFSLLADSRGVRNIEPLPLGIILLALVVIQATVLYYVGDNEADENETYWMLSIIGGFLLFLLVGAFVFFAFTGVVVLAVLLLVLGIIFGNRVFHQVQEGHVDIVLRFGRYHHTMKPGLNLLYPWETILASPRTQEITWTTPPVRLTTAHDQDVELVAAVTYQLDARDAHFAVKEVADWETDLHQHFVGVLKSVAYELAPDDFIGWSHHIHNRAQAVDNLANSLIETRWDRLNKALKRRLEDQVAKNGITIHMVQVLDMTVISRSTHSTPVDTGIVRSLAAQPAQSSPPLSAQQAAIAAQPTAQPGQVVLPTPESSATPAKPFVLTPSKIQGMKDAFDSIRDGRLTALGTIVKLRRDFEQIAANPELDAQFPYDAKQAISSLNKRIDAIQAEAKSGQVAASAVPAPVAAARPARRLPRMPNDNLAGGG